MYHLDMLSSDQQINNCSVEILYRMHAYFPYLKKILTHSPINFPLFSNQAPNGGIC